MLSRLKIITILMMILSLFGLVQIVSGGLFFRSLDVEKERLSELRTFHNEHSELNSVWIELLKTRSIIGVSAIQHLVSKEQGGSTHLDSGKLLTDASTALQKAERHWKNYTASIQKSMKYYSVNIHGKQDKLNDSYSAFHDALQDLIHSLQQNDIDTANKQPTQAFQDAFDTAYNEYIERIANEFKIAEYDANNAENIAFWMQTIFLIIVLLLIIIVWIGLRNALLIPLTKTINSIQQIAAGNLSTHIELSGFYEVRQLATILLHMQNELIQMVSNVRNSADEVMNGASHISTGSQDLSARTEQQAASLEETAASMSELTTTVKQNADNAAQARQVVINASEIAKRGSKAVDSMVHTIGDITDSSQKINDITKVIDGIAFQTNILSINAAVEAARAGTQGRGFAVVANEVRRLALSSAKAAKEIKTLIDDSSDKVKTGSTLATAAGDTMNEIVNAVEQVTALMIEIAAASDEQSRGIEQIGIAITTMDGVTQQNNALANKSTSAALELENQVNCLTQAVAKFAIQ
ncbi:methyl-accepting chemotaxis protein [Enterobacteriaceae bacterium ESL0689]|nr:methyl-accepting chemotaxis protein [Enterobacteriaceae bacterium ESL0689]